MWCRVLVLSFLSRSSPTWPIPTCLTGHRHSLRLALACAVNTSGSTDVGTSSVRFGRHPGSARSVAPPEVSESRCARTLMPTHQRFDPHRPPDYQARCGCSNHPTGSRGRSPGLRQPWRLSPFDAAFLIGVNYWITSSATPGPMRPGMWSCPRDLYEARDCHHSMRSHHAVTSDDLAERRAHLETTNNDPLAFSSVRPSSKPGHFLTDPIPCGSWLGPWRLLAGPL